MGMKTNLARQEETFEIKWKKSLWQIARKILFRMDPEAAHTLGGFFLERGANFLPPASRRFRQTGKLLGGKKVTSPLGLAAGFDKDGKYIEALARLGFGFVEVGTVTPFPQAGNPRPRMFRLPHSQALVNRLGFNSEGMEAVAKRLEAFLAKGPYPMPVGVNLGKNRTTPNEQALNDYLLGLERFFGVADFFVINLSSPNTPGLRNLLAEAELAPLVKGLAEKNRKLGASHAHGERELFLKVSPDMESEGMKRAVELALEAGFKGVVATNTTLRRDLTGIDARDSKSLKEMGGLSGAPLKQLAGPWVKELRAMMGPEPTLISVGGIDSLAEARLRLDAGADFLEIYTSFIYEGPDFPAEIARGLNS
jgi:dihydroorotate dehydrogenase